MPSVPLPRVVQVGFNKCGTRSLARLFEGAGHKALHHKHRPPFRKSQTAARILRDNLAAGRPALAGIEGYTFYSDLIHVTPTEYFEGNTAFRQILRDYPGTILLLNLRDREAWIASRLRHGHGEFARRAMAALNLPDQDALVAKWRADWDTQIAALRSEMADRPDQLIEFDLDRDPVEKLVAALPAYGLNPADWGDTGRSRGRRLPPPLAWAKRAWAHLRPRSRR
ncbi:sulfotransferase [Rhodovulum adriaticum]|uniref:Sulfotransferase family protein n=1 Tax=Rhodovulum adriaticum TaxID=35804 RepID=A0A4R2NWH2_RHOAD|nr:sulfotransferase [Rhodovulum adriaticum]MBK1636243.1 hypothetical protein [Rhodovulum adriaticum]TCP26503.1 hypothetical protein EV656_102472 [Rhodovulum adriaticum]